MAISNSPACDSDPGHLTTPVHLPINEVAIGAVVAGVEGAEPLALPVGGHSAANLSSLILSYQPPSSYLVCGGPSQLRVVAIGGGKLEWFHLRIFL